MDQVELLASLVTEKIKPQSVAAEQRPEIIALALREGLGPMLYWSLKRAGVDTETDKTFEPLAAAGRQAGIHYALLNNYQAQIDASLREAGIPALWLKGIALAHTVYPQPWTRPMVDLDLLVPYAQRGDALSHVEALGFHPSNQPDVLKIEVPEDLEHHAHLMGGVAGAVCLELHHRLLGVDGLELLPWEDLEWFWGNNEEVTGDWGRMRVLKPEAHLLYLCAHALLQHGESNLQLLQTLDLHLLVTKYKLDWELVVERAIKLKWSYAIQRALTLTGNTFDSPIPPWVLDELHKNRPFEEDTSRASRLADQGSRWESEMLLLSKLPYPTRLRIVSSLLFPSKDFIRQRYAIADNQPVLPYYFYRWYDSGREVMLAMRTRYTKRTQKGA